MNIAIAENIRRLRRAHDMTQDELAQVLGVSAQSVSKWEVGASYPDLETIPLIANFFDATVDELLGMEGIRDEKRIYAEFMRREELRKTAIGCNQDDAEAVYAQCREITRQLALEFPKNDMVQMNHVYDLVNEGEYETALPIVERVLARSTDAGTRLGAVTQQLVIYQALGQHDKVAEVLATIPSIWRSREYVMMTMTNTVLGTDAEDMKFLRSLFASLCVLTSIAADRMTIIESFDDKAQYVARLRILEAFYALVATWGDEELSIYDSHRIAINAAEWGEAGLAHTRAQISSRKEA